MARHTVYFQWPHNVEPEPYDLEQAWAMFMRRKESEGYSLGRVYRIWRTPELVVNSKGDMVKEYNMEIELTRRPTHQIYDIPDENVADVLKNIKGAKLIE